MATMTAGAIPTEIVESLAKFKADHPNTGLLGFVMMRFSDTPAHREIISSARNAAGVKISLLRADDKEYHSDLYYNILTYIYGCSFGVAVFERIEQDDFNPNVSFEVGYMLALKKPVLLLKDKNLKVLHTDLVGKLYRPFDAQSISATLPSQITKWLGDQKLV